MERWEFLLQKEGDNTWLPLESPDVEILEGRYRIVARSNHSDRKIAVRIIYQNVEDVPPVRQVQNRTTTTTPEGLMVVIPYTLFKPGLWELICSPASESNLVSPSEEAKVQLRVLHTDSEIGEEPAYPETPAAEQANTEISSDFQSIPETTNSKILQFPKLTTSTTSPDSKADFEPNAESPAPSEINPSAIDAPASSTNTPESPSEASENTKIRCIIEPNSYVARLGQGFVISGRLEPLPVSTEAEQTEVHTLTSCQLLVNLRDPQTSEPLIEVKQNIPTQALPIHFASVVYIPFECQTRLILGEAVVEENTVLLTSQSFTVVTEVEHILGAIQEDFGEEYEEAAITPDLPAELQAIAFEPSENLETQPSEEVSRFNPVLPPKLNTPISEPKSASALELPTFTPSSSQPEPVMATSGQQESATSPVTSEPEPVTDSTLMKTQPTVETPKKAVNPAVEAAFQSLHLDNRFLSRLSALAQDREWSQWMKRSTPAPLPDISFTPSKPIAQQPSASQPEPDDESSVSGVLLDWESEEVVVDDDLLELSPSSVTRPQPFKGLPGDGTASVTPTSPYVLPESEPIPAPILDVLTEELIAGRAAKARVRLPDGLPRIYVKIWVYDRQARQVVDGPRWLTEFSPNGFEQIETTVNLEIPFGSLDVEFNAIAIEMQTQRESQKVSVERGVSPPPAPTLPLES